MRRQRAHQFQCAGQRHYAVDVLDFAALDFGVLRFHVGIGKVSWIVVMLGRPCAAWVTSSGIETVLSAATAHTRATGAWNQRARHPDRTGRRGRKSLYITKILAAFPRRTRKQRVSNQSIFNGPEKKDRPVFSSRSVKERRRSPCWERSTSERSRRDCSRPKLLRGLLCDDHARDLVV